jgi:hypothetical protein
MKEIKAIIKPFMLEAVIEALREIKVFPPSPFLLRTVFLPRAERSTKW